MKTLSQDNAKDALVELFGSDFERVNEMRTTLLKAILVTKDPCDGDHVVSEETERRITGLFRTMTELFDAMPLGSSKLSPALATEIIDQAFDFGDKTKLTGVWEHRKNLNHLMLVVLDSEKVISGELDQSEVETIVTLFEAINTLLDRVETLYQSFANQKLVA